jgi:DNA-binding NarL/FixJ family response regulator
VCLSVKTISTYRTRIMEKMNLKKNAELTLYAIQHHLIAYDEQANLNDSIFF